MPREDGAGTSGQGAGAGRGRKRGKGFGGGFVRGPDGECMCPNCGHRESHAIAVPCYSKRCPKCGAPMTRV